MSCKLISDGAWLFFRASAHVAQCNPTRCRRCQWRGRGTDHAYALTGVLALESQLDHKLRKENVQCYTDTQARSYMLI